MSPTALDAHLASGATTVCRAWTITRRDGTVQGFTDHDGDLVLDGVSHRAATGLTARALQQNSGLSVDNSEAFGALSDTSISEADLAAGRYDMAEVRIRLVNWADPAQSAELFRGAIGEVARTGAEFRAELRGLTERLNQPVGHAYTRGCSAVLGDSRCQFDLTAPGYSVERAVEVVDSDRHSFRFAVFAGFDDRWFESGRLEVTSGAGAGLVGFIKSDRQSGGGRIVDLWQGFRADVQPGDMLRLVAGCDKRADTCRLKFANLLNYRGFPHIPGEDWLSAYPRSGQRQSGGALTTGGGA